MGGAANRDGGHRWEVACAKWLSEMTGLDVQTTRALGASYGADVATVTAYDQLGRPVSHIPTVLGYSVECKRVDVRCPRQWLRQAVEQSAPSAVPVVLWRRRRMPALEGSAFLLDDDAPRGWREVPITEWFEHLQVQGAP